MWIFDLFGKWYVTSNHMRIDAICNVICYPGVGLEFTQFRTAYLDRKFKYSLWKLQTEK